MTLYQWRDGLDTEWAETFRQSVEISLAMGCHPLIVDVHK